MRRTTAHDGPMKVRRPNHRISGHADTGAVLGTSDLRHSGTVPNAGRISGCYRHNHFLRFTARVIVQSNKTYYVLVTHALLVY